MRLHREPSPGLPQAEQRRSHLHSYRQRRWQAAATGRALPRSAAETASAQQGDAQRATPAQSSQPRVPDGDWVPSAATPLLDAVVQWAQNSEAAPFHVPGHKGGKGVSKKFKDMAKSGILKHDLTELPGLDYLASPSGPIARAQQLAAVTFHADHTWLLVNGSTVGVLASVMSVAGPGDTLLLARNCHQSAFAGMTLAGCTPWWLPPEVDASLGIAHTVTPDTLRRELAAALAAGRRVTGVLVVSPTYFGVCADVAGLAQVCNAAGIPLIVDEAHGAHFGQHATFPASAMQQGAHLAVQSTHKTLSAMTQAAMLHVKGDLVDRTRVARTLQILQTSSPSYILMSSLDAARAQLQDAEQCFAKAIKTAQEARKGLAAIPGITVLSHESNTQTPGMAHLDPLRLTVCVSGLGLTGYQVADILDTDLGVASELATQQVVVFVLGPGSVPQDAANLVSAFKTLACRLRGLGVTAPQTASSSGNVHRPSGSARAWQQPKAQLSPRDAYYAKTERVAFAAAKGRVSAELLCPYPPGVPVLFPGEVITDEALGVLEAAVASGGKVTGPSDQTLETLLVVQA